MENQQRSLRSNNPNLQLGHWPPLDPETPTICWRRKSNSVNVEQVNMEDNNNNAGNEQAAAPLPEAGQPNSSKWCANPMVADFNPGTTQGQRIFESKTRGLPEDKKFEAISKEGNEIRKYLLGKQGILGGIVTSIPTSFNADGSIKSTANLIKQYQLVKFEDVQREAYKRFVGDLAPDAPLPAGPWMISQLDPENNQQDRARCYK